VGDFIGSLFGLIENLLQELREINARHGGHHQQHES
jgi:hypothetical protein